MNSKLLKITEFLSRDSWSVKLVVFFTSTLVVILFWSILPRTYKQEPHSDFRAVYHPTARNLVDGKGYVFGDGIIALRYPPGYPILLAISYKTADVIGIKDKSILPFFILMYVGLSSVLIFSLARSLWSPGIALGCYLIWLSYPFLLWMTKQPYTEIPFMVFLLGAILLFWKSIKGGQFKHLGVYLSGLLVGASMLVRPISIGLGFVLCFFTAVFHRELKAKQRIAVMALIMAGTLTLVGPWEFWAFQKSGQVLILTQDNSMAIRDGLTFAVKSKGYRTGTYVPDDVREFMTEIAEDHYETFNSLKDVVALMASELLKRPVTVIKFYLLKLARSWYGTDSQRFELAVFLIQLPYLLLSISAIIFAIRLGGRERKYAILVSCIIVYFWLMSLVGLTLARYMAPVAGLMFMIWPVLLPERFRKTTP